MLSPAKLSKSGGGAPGSDAPGSGAPGYGRTWVHLIAFSRCGLELFFRFFASHIQLAASLLSLAQHSSQVSAVQLSAVQLSSAVQRRALPCAALWCDALPCFAVLRTYQVSYEKNRYQRMYVRRKQNHQNTPAPLSLARSTAQRSAVRCRAVSCPAVRCGTVPCGAVLCGAFSFEHTRRQRWQGDRVGESQHVLEHLIQQF